MFTDKELRAKKEESFIKDLTFFVKTPYVIAYPRLSHLYLHPRMSQMLSFILSDELEFYYDNIFIFYNCMTFIKSLGSYYDSNLNAIKNEEELMDEDSELFVSPSRSRF